MNLEQAQDKAVAILGEIKNLPVPKIETDSDYAHASDSVSFINKKLQEVELLRKSMTRPLIERQKQINSAFKSLTLPSKAILDTIKASMLVFYKQAQTEQLKLESEAMENSDESVLVVDDKIANIKKAGFSSNTKKTTIKYRLKDETLEDVISIKQLKLKQWLKKNKLPDFIEQYEEESIIVRKK